MFFPPVYALNESFRVNTALFGASVKHLCSSPAFQLFPHAAIFAAWGKLTERTFNRMAATPEWGIDKTVSAGREYTVEVRPVFSKTFCRLIHFDVDGKSPQDPKILLVAPMSGHYATLLRRTVTSLLPDCELFVTEWRNARDIPVTSGDFDIEDFTRYIAEFIRFLGPDTHVIAVCQPVPLSLAAVAHLADAAPESQPRTLTLIGGPAVPDAAPTSVTDFGNRVAMGHLEQFTIQPVGRGHAGAGRKVYPGMLQLGFFLSMNPPRHLHAFLEQISRAIKNMDAEDDRHNRFYDEYLAVMDMTAEFYLSTVRRLFKDGEIAHNKFTLGGRPVDLEKISHTAVLTVEGGKDDISAPGQCSGALELLSGLPDSKKASHIEPDAGHYGIFSGQVWQRSIRPLILSFIAANTGSAH
ncbi:MAG: polyhydroxyalkanoate depolymerase [Rhodobacteraceae bacterium]|nr:polyhydroxyalkanoate depolymerase [Paracoccaceae bacterium]